MPLLRVSAPEVAAILKRVTRSVIPKGLEVVSCEEPHLGTSVLSLSGWQERSGA